jgi:site-specific recombinase XerD
MMEATRGNRVSTRNQRLAALHTFYRYLSLQNPEMLDEAQRVEAIPVKRTTPPQTEYLEHDESRLSSRAFPNKERLRFEIKLSSCSSITPEHGCRKSPT